LRKQIDALIKADGAAASRQLRDYSARIEKLQQQLAASSTDGGYVSGERQLRERMGELYGAVVSYDGRPSASQQREHDNVTREFAARSADANALYAELPARNAELGKRGATELKLLDRKTWEAKENGAGPTSVARRWADCPGCWISGWY
jgi:hypothetical protein